MIFTCDNCFDRDDDEDGDDADGDEGDDAGDDDDYETDQAEIKGCSSVDGEGDW